MLVLVTSPNPLTTAELLTDELLYKQRLEVVKLLDAIDNEVDHPAVKMWKDHRDFLVTVGVAFCVEWQARGHRDNTLDKLLPQVTIVVAQPPWLDDVELHQSHVAYLIRKDAQHYRPLFPDLQARVPIKWCGPENEAHQEQLRLDRLRRKRDRINAELEGNE